MKNYKKKYLNKEHLVNEPMVQYQAHRCLYCYEPLVDPNAHFHETCNKKFFGQLETPLLAYNFSDLNKLAQKIILSQMAVTGAQPKLSLSIDRKKSNNQTKRLTLVGLYGDYILKPPSAHYKELPELEDVTMHMANVCGLKVVPHSLVYLQDNTLCYITKRVDRTKKGKVHMEDMCQLTERLTEDKYKGSHEQVGKVLLKHSLNPLLDVTNFYEYVLFSFFTGNADMHLKNFSLLQFGNQGYVLAPAYDLVPTKLVLSSDKEELALTLNAKKSKLQYNDFLKAFETNGLNKKVLDTTLENFYYCKNEMLGVLNKSFVSDSLKNKYADLLEQRYKRLGL